MQVLSLLPFLVWYVLPGLNLLTFCVALPILALNFPMATALSAGDLVAAGVLAVVLGFVMDALKLYRLTPQYRSQRDEHFARLGEALGVSGEDARRVFDIVRAAVRTEKSAETVELDHSRWVMINHTSKTFFLAAFIWLVVGTAHSLSSSTVVYFGLLSTRFIAWKLLVDAGFMVLNSMIGLRMQRVAFAEASTSDMNYLIFVRRNAERLRSEITAHLPEARLLES